ncbi:MAG: phosphoglycerate mutase family protein [Bacteroidota bacterium]
MRNLLAAVLLFVCVNTFAQTTFILVRHAEKDNGKDNPALSAEGKQRALALAKLLEKQKIDAIYSTDFNRTKETVRPLADSKGLQITIYDRQPDLAGLKGTIVICGHSNTIPALANKLIGKEQFKDFADNDFGNLLIISDGSVTHLRY